MSFRVSVEPSGRQFDVEVNETILTAALRQGVALPYGCKNGACGSCKGTVVTGTFTQGKYAPSALSPSEQVAGKALFCCAFPSADMTIECREIAGAGDIPIKKLPARIANMQRLGHDVMIIKLQLPATERLQFLAGQYIELLLRNGERRSYSIANAPEIEGPIELHVRHMPGGMLTDMLFGDKEPVIKERDILRFEGPLGSFFLREESDQPIVMLASGTGFAPVKAIIESMAFKNIKRPIKFYWGGRRPQDLYMHNICQGWQQAMPHLTYIPVVSEALPEDNWAGRTGLVHRAVMADLPDLSDYQVYACGAPVMVEAARQDFINSCCLPEQAFFADAFISEADKAKG